MVDRAQRHVTTATLSMEMGALTLVPSKKVGLAIWPQHQTHVAQFVEMDEGTEMRFVMMATLSAQMDAPQLVRIWSQDGLVQ